MSESTSNQYKNDNITVSVEEGSKGRVTFHIAVSPKAATAAYARAVKNVNKEVSIPGFRKGKAPESLIAKQFAKPIDEEWVNIFTNTAFSEALQLTGIQPFKGQRFGSPKMQKKSQEEGVEFTLSFDRVPEVPSIDPASIQLEPLTKPEVADSDVEKALEDLKAYHATESTLEPRKIALGDFVKVDIDTLDEEALSICKNQRLEVQSEKIAPWLLNLLVGAEVGQALEGVAESRDADGQGRPCRVVVNSLVEMVKPELNDELAKKAGCETVDQLRTNVRKSLEHRAETAYQTALRDRLEEALLKLYPLELPQWLVDKEVTSRVRSSNEALREVRMTDHEIALHQDEIKQSATRSAQRSLQLSFLAFAYFKKQNEGITRDELQRELDYQKHAFPDERVLHNEMSGEEIREKLVEQAYRRKLVERLLQEVS